MLFVKLKELKEKLSGARKKMNDSGRLLWYGVSYTDRWETRHKKRVKNIINGYPICNNDFATVERLEALSIAYYEKTPIQPANAEIK
ncbi:hypothetical protein BYT27DRAFT_7196452 [Phlegmacium glaucopus]|nr:hypothetical protein BYT27DRAFT_7196452 [Phlegmacium glaucopus]